MNATLNKTTPSGQQVIDPAGRELTARDTRARIDPTRCVTGGAGDDFRGSAWVAVVGSRDDVGEDPAKILATRFWLGDRADGGIERQVGPVPDDGTVAPPGDPALMPNRPSMSADEYLQRSAEMNVGRRSAQCVCFYLVRLARVN